MERQKVINLLYVIYNAGFNHGVNEGPFPEHGTFDAFNRLIVGESPMLDNASYAIKEKVEELFSLVPPMQKNLSVSEIQMKNLTDVIDKYKK